jgi:hypothetical protein
MTFTWLHGITWDDVKGMPGFAALWPRISGLLHDVDWMRRHLRRSRASGRPPTLEHYRPFVDPNWHYKCVLRDVAEFSRKTVALSGFSRQHRQ